MRSTLCPFCDKPLEDHKINDLVNCGLNLLNSQSSKQNVSRRSERIQDVIERKY